MMGKHYKKRPSEILHIKSEYLAFCVDEVAYYLEIQATDEDGNINWSKIKWEDRKIGNNNEQIKFIQDLNG